jgi:hypothetical protein
MTDDCAAAVPAAPAAPAGAPRVPAPPPAAPPPSTDTSSSDGDGFDELIRAKGMWDGCSTLDEVKEATRAQIRWVEGLQAEGFELRGPVEDDYAFLVKRAPGGRA